MFALKTLFFVLAFVAVIVSSVPVHERRSHKLRRSCPGKTQASVSVTSTAPTSTAANGTTTTSHTSAASLHDSNSDDTSSTKSSTKTSSTAKETSTSSTNTSPSKGKGLLAALFPVSSSGDSWTTLSSASDALSLSDGTLKPAKVLSALSHSYVTAPDGKKAMKAHYPAGSYTFGHDPQGGFSFYAPGPDSVDLTTAKEATFGYSVYFPEGFDFQKGGKLPGLYGGDSDSVATSCSGGRRDTRCFSARLMWRTAGAGEFYTYLPPYTIPAFAANKKQCNVAPQSDCNPTYGASVGRGSFKFATGAWTTVSERVRLNDVGKANGELQLFVNGKSVINVSGLILTDSSAGRIRGMQMQTFFGGNSQDFASPKSQDVYFADFSAAITEKL